MRALLVTLLFGVGLGVVTMNLFDPDRSARLAMLQRDHARMHTLIERTARENAALSAELRSLEEGPAGWNEVARREHGMIHKGEVVFRFPVAPRSAP